MNQFDAVLIACALLSLAGICGVARFAYFGFKLPTTWTDKVLALLLTVINGAGAGVLGAWTCAAIETPPPSTVTWENISHNPDAGWWNRQVSWAALETGWVKPTVEPGFFYSRAHFGEGEERVNLVALPGGTWAKL